MLYSISIFHNTSKTTTIYFIKCSGCLTKNFHKKFFSRSRMGNYLSLEFSVSRKINSRAATGSH